MASTTTPATGALYKRLIDLIVQACEADDLDLISQALTVGTKEQVIKLAFPRAFSRNAPKILKYLLTHGSDTDIEDIGGKAPEYIARVAYEQTFPKSLVQTLLDYGWDINSRGRNHDQPLLWKIVNDGDAVAWCLERGASVLPEGQKPWPELDIDNAIAYGEYFERCPFSNEEVSDCLYYCPPILEHAAQRSTVATFELLRSKGAPLGCGTQQENPLDEGEQHLSDRELACTPAERMNMVRHLVDTLKLDVNARDQPPGYMLRKFFGGPLHYVAQSIRPNGDCREVTLFLLQRGADPELLYGEMTPLAYGEWKENFLDAVKEWRLMQTGNTVQTSDGEH